ncbi:hypothetical protein PG989_008692 [Apiospora arundinis]
MASRPDTDQHPGLNDDESGSSYAGSDNGSTLESFPPAAAPYDDPVHNSETIEDHPHSAEDQDSNAAPEPANQQAESSTDEETTESHTTTETPGVITESPNEHVQGSRSPIAIGEVGAAAAPSNQASEDRDEPAEQPSTSTAEPTRVPGLTLLEALNDMSVSPRNAVDLQNELPPLPGYDAEPSSSRQLPESRTSQQGGRRGDGASLQTTGLAPAHPVQQARTSDSQGCVGDHPSSRSPDGNQTLK